MAGVVAIFDFDKTIIDVDSDNWVIDEFGFMERFDELLKIMPWNALMDKIMGEMHDAGKTIEDITNALITVPIYPQIISAIKAAHSLGCDLRVVSDANQFYIETILKHHGLLDYFSEINTNPGYVDDAGRLRIQPYHDYHTSAHGCPLCPPNMCKGLVMDRIVSSLTKDSMTQRSRIVYLGDGAGDYCPSLRLNEGDKVMPRKDFPLWNLIEKNPLLMKAEVHPWINAIDQEETLLKLLNSMDMRQMIMQDCKSHSMFVVPHETVLRRPLPVRQ